MTKEKACVGLFIYVNLKTYLRGSSLEEEIADPREPQRSEREMTKSQTQNITKWHQLKVIYNSWKINSVTKKKGPC